MQARVSGSLEHYPAACKYSVCPSGRRPTLLCPSSEPRRSCMLPYAAQEPTSPGAASTISAPAMATRGGGSAQGPRQHPTRPLSSASTASSSTAGVSPHAADLARMQARSAWEPTPVPLRYGHCVTGLLRAKTLGAFPLPPLYCMNCTACQTQGAASGFPF